MKVEQVYTLDTSVAIVLQPFEQAEKQLIEKVRNVIGGQVIEKHKRQQNQTLEKIQSHILNPWLISAYLFDENNQ